MNSTAHDAHDADSRHESSEQRADRNWNEILQELRVMQTGAQILTGFLLTLPFQQRFTTLDSVEIATYMVLVGLSVLTTGLLVMPVSWHRLVFRRHRKVELVTTANRITRVGLMTLALVMTGTVLLVTDVVIGLHAAIAAAIVTVLVLIGLWFLFPRHLFK